MPPLIHYFATLNTARLVLWCYLIWYGVTVYFHFDASPALWLNALGISVIIGVALLLSVSSQGKLPADRWQIFRLFLMPFCVSSFSSLIKGQGFVLILPPDPQQQLITVGACLGFVLMVKLLQAFCKR